MVVEDCVLDVILCIRVSVVLIIQVKHLMGWSAPAAYCSSSEDEAMEEAEVELCHPLCQCHRCAPTQKVFTEININFLP